VELGSLQLGFGMVNRILIKREVLAEGGLETASQLGNFVKFTSVNLQRSSSYILFVAAILTDSNSLEGLPTPCLAGKCCGLAGLFSYWH